MSFLLWPESHSPTFPLRKCKEFQPSTEGVDRRARRSHRYRGGGHKTLLAVSVLAPGASVLPVKLWGSYGCNEVVGTQVAITAQLNCHQHLMEAQDQTLTESKYLQIPSEAQISSRHAAAFKITTAGVWVVWNIFHSSGVICARHLTCLTETSVVLKQTSWSLYGNISTRFST